VRGGSGAARDGGATGGRSGHRGGTGGDGATSGTDSGEGGDGSDGDDGDDGDDDSDAGVGGTAAPSGGTSSGAGSGSCNRAGKGGCGHAGSGMSGSGGGGGVSCSGAGGCGHAGRGMGGSAAGASRAGSGGCDPGGAGAGGMPGGAGGSAGLGGAGGGLALVVNADIFPFSCDHSHPFEVHRVAYESGALVTNYTCEWTFDGGGTSQSCAGTHEFPAAGRYGGTVVVRDTSTGAIGTKTTPKIPVVDPLSMTITAEAPNCGLTISYVTTIAGGRGGHTNILFSPFENVLTQGPWPRSGTVEVSASGTYEVGAVHEEETATGPICEATATTQVIVSPCP
jgi:hypothetical protein